MNLKARLPGLVRVLTQIFQCIKMVRVVFGPLLIMRVVIGIRSLPHLHKHGVAVHRAKPRQQRVALRGRLEAVVEAVHPERPQLRPRVGIDGGRGQCGHGQQQGKG